MAGAGNELSPLLMTDREASRAAWTVVGVVGLFLLLFLILWFVRWMYRSRGRECVDECDGSSEKEFNAHVRDLKARHIQTCGCVHVDGECSVDGILCASGGVLTNHLAGLGKSVVAGDVLSLKHGLEWTVHRVHHQHFKIPAANSGLIVCTHKGFTHAHLPKACHAKGREYIVANKTGQPHVRLSAHEHEHINDQPLPVHFYNVVNAARFLSDGDRWWVV